MAFVHALTLGLTLSLLGSAPHSKEMSQWFETFKQEASPLDMYRFLYALPKGGDLHNHLSGSNFSEWLYNVATDSQRNGGYEYFTKIKINNCHYGHDQFGIAPYLMLFRNIQRSSYDALSECERDEYKPLVDLSESEKTAWLESLRLDKPHEGREEFFQRHWQRLNDLDSNPHIGAEMMFKNMQAFSQENVVYLETQVTTLYKKAPDGRIYSPEEVVQIFKQRLQQADVLSTGVTLRLQHFLLRFTPNAEEELEKIYHFVHKNRDLFVGINMVGREDNDKGHPLRFLSTLRKLRKTIPAIKLSIHAGEVDEPNSHVRDTLLLGAERIGHGINLISDPETMLLMRHSPYMIEINLISNLLLNYVDNYRQHPFPEYLRFGIPVALSTDDRGMWDSNLTDEYYVAVTEFNLSWAELVQLGLNSLKYAFVESKVKQELIDSYWKRIKIFSEKMLQNKTALQDIHPTSHRFLCQHYKICLTAKNSDSLSN